ncbi:MAG TPA: hypothetical protein VFT01_02330 [Homoserinimonas sp.]|nr:hypothetical protein [Homoserinimonas sp.]
MSFTEENTLGVIVGRRRGRGGQGGTTTTRAMRQAKAMGARLGTGRLGIGTGIVAGLLMLIGLARFAWSYDEYPDTLLVSIAWLLLISSLGSVAVSIAARGENLPGWMYAGILVMIAVVIALDFIAIWPMHDIATWSSASIAAGAGLLIAVTLRSTRDILIPTVALVVVFAVAFPLSAPPSVVNLPTQLAVVALAAVPPLIGVYMVRMFRHLVQTELDRVLVQSTVSAPRFAVGMLASEELARLDLAAEELLDSVATGRTKLPLTPKMASTAASLATELRLHLIEGRRETWLYHAVTESETLGKSVVLTDPGSLAGLLDSGQRDGLFAAIWLLVSEKRKSPANIKLTLGPANAAVPGLPAGKICVPVVVSTTGVARNRVGPAVWEALSRVGDFSDGVESSSLRVDIQCMVENPAEQ